MMAQKNFAIRGLGRPGLEAVVHEAAAPACVMLGLWPTVTTVGVLHVM
jgi:hypothetical protein